MIQLDDLTMGKKLLILVIVGILAISIVGFVGIYSTDKINSQLTQLYQNKYSHSVLAIQTYNEMLNYAVEGYKFSLESDMKKKEQMLNENMLPKIDIYNEKIAAYESIPMNEEEKQVIDKLKQYSLEYFDIVGRVNTLTLEGKTKEASELRDAKAGAKRLETMGEIQKLVELNNQSAYQYYVDSNVMYVNILLATIIITIVCAFILLIISWFIIRNLNRRFNLLKFAFLIDFLDCYCRNFITYIYTVTPGNLHFRKRI